MKTMQIVPKLALICAALFFFTGCSTATLLPSLSEGQNLKEVIKDIRAHATQAVPGVLKSQAVSQTCGKFYFGGKRHWFISNDETILAEAQYNSKKTGIVYVYEGTTHLETYEDVAVWTRACGDPPITFGGDDDKGITLSSLNGCAGDKGGIAHPCNE